jgi:threonine dehydratase
MDPRILASVIYRQLERESRIVTLRILIDDRPGMLGRIATLVGQHGANILEVSHQRMYLDIPAKGAELELMLETRDARHAEEIVALVENQGFVTRVLDSSGGRDALRRR